MTNSSPRTTLASFCAASVFFASCLVPFFVWAQSVSPESSARIKKTIRLVEVDVIAKDKKGQPVADLEAKDFSLRDNGQLEKITSFSIQKRGDRAEEKVENDPAATRSSPSPTTQVFSNTHPSSSVPVVILVDLANTSWDNQPAMQSALLASLKNIPPQTPTALLILGDELKVISDFTTDTNSLANLSQKSSTSGPEGFGPAITASRTSSAKANDVILKTAVRAFNQETGNRLDRTMRALNVIRNQLIRMQGRKSLIWIGGGLSVNPHDWPAIRNLIDELNDANVAVYTVDARGVLLDHGIGADYDDRDMLGPRTEEQAEARGAILDVIARNTGGVPYRNTNALDRAITRAVDDNRMVYTLGYYPHRNDWQGKPHRIEVKVARPGINLRYRPGYLATPEANPEPADQQQMLDAILASPLDFPGLRFRVEAKPGTDFDTESLTLLVPASELQLVLQDEKMVGALQLWFIQRQAAGQDLARKTSSFSFKLTNSEFQDTLAHGLTLTSVLRLNKATARVRVLLRDINSGRVGTVDVPLTAMSTPTQEH